MTPLARCPIGALALELYELVVGRVQRGELTGEEALAGTAAALAELLASEPRRLLRATATANLVLGLPKLVARRVQHRLERDPVYGRAVMEMNPVEAPSHDGKPH